MSLEIIISELEKSPGNLCRNQNEIYISLNNMLTVPSLIKKSEELYSILITPYLIDKNVSVIFELHYYEFDIEVCDSEESYLVDYPNGNLLSKDIIDNFKPGAFVALRDFDFYEKILNNYLVNIQKASFKEERKSDNRLDNSMLYFQIF